VTSSEKPAKKATEKAPATNASAKTEVKKAEVKLPYVRASNDPRVAAKPIENLTISSETLHCFTGESLNTALAADITHLPRDLARPANDPRGAKATAVEAVEETTKVVNEA
jgi:ribonuclease E